MIIMIMKWAREELNQMGQRTKKLMTIEEKDLPALKTAWMHRYNDSKTT